MVMYFMEAGIPREHLTCLIDTWQVIGDNIILIFKMNLLILQ